MNAQLKPVSIVRTIEQGTSKRFAHSTLVGATLIVLLIGAIAMGQTITHRSPTAITHPGTTMQERHFLEVNTAWLATSVMPDVVPATVLSERSKFLEVNTMLGMGAESVAPSASTASERRLLEVNTQIGMGETPALLAYPYGEAVTPNIGKPR